MGEGSANIIYFAYGSNMCPQQMAVRCPGGRAFGQAELRDWQFLINTRTYATVKASTHGVLWSLTPANITALDVYEAVADGMYNKISLIVQIVGEQVEALVYIDPVCEPGQPGSDYLQTILDGAAHFGLPPDYIASLARDWGAENVTSGSRE